MNNAIQELKNLKDAYVKGEAQRIINRMVKFESTETKESTCDAPNWDNKLHAHFPEIAKELESQGLVVSRTVNWGVTDWSIRIK